MSWPVLLVIAAGAYAFKLIGVFAGERATLLLRAERLLALLPPAVLAGLIMVQTFDGGRRLVIDARAAGLAAGAIAVWRKAPFVLVVIVAAAVTALVRAV
jgi:hypothetical protein